MTGNTILSAGELATTSFSGASNPPYRILVVDDEPLIRLLNTEVLINHGYEVEAAEDGAMAWDELQFNSYDLLITDNDMPNLSGVDLLKKLHAARMALPVIMVTGTYPGEEFIRFPWLLPNASLLKPYPIAILMETVREVLRASDRDGLPMATLPDWQDQPFVIGA